MPVYSINAGIADGTTADSVAAGSYWKTVWDTVDLLRHQWGGTGVTGTGQIQVSTATKRSLVGATIDWGVY